MQEIPYVGNELELFQHATTWKNYFGKFLQPYLKGKVLEVGAGIGGTTLHLCDGTQTKWTCLEPDRDLFQELKRKVDAKELPACCEAVKGVISDLPPSVTYNTIMYIDVIEHIEDDRAELASAYNYLDEGGYLLVLVPAHQYVFSPFDKSIGHYRRYNKKMLRQAAPKGVTVKRMWYLDSMGLIASVVNKLFLKQSYPTTAQVSMWDKKLVPISKFADRLINYQTGKTLVAIWQKTSAQK